MQVVMVCIITILSKGWTISKVDIDDRKGLLVVLGVYFTLQVCVHVLLSPCLNQSFQPIMLSSPLFLLPLYACLLSTNKNVLNCIIFIHYFFGSRRVCSSGPIMYSFKSQQSTSMAQSREYLLPLSVW